MGVETQRGGFVWQTLWRGVGVVPPGSQGWGNSVRGC